MKLEKLVDKAKNGDNESFAYLINEYQECLYKIARVRLKNEDDICDAVQNAIFYAYKSIGSLRENKYFKTWLIKILINCCNDVYEKSEKNYMPLDEVDRYKCFDDYNFTENFDIDYLISCLSHEDQTILVLYYQEGYKESEIAKIMKINYSTVRTKIRRAKQKIVVILEEEEI